MNRLFHFSTGTLFTFAFNNSLTSCESEYFLLRQLVSIIGGILSTIVIAWLKHRWDNRGNSSMSG